MKIFKILSVVGILSILSMFSNVASAQDTYVYQRTDTKTHVTSYMKLTFNGYQVSVSVRASSANGTSPWSKQEVTYTDDHEIRYKGKTSGNSYSITYDEYNHDAILLYNETTGKELKYYISE